MLRISVWRCDSPVTAARLIGKVFHAGSDDRAAVNAGQRALLAKIVEILADGLRRHLEAARQIFHHHPTGGAGEIEDFGLAMGQAGHGVTLARSERTNVNGGLVAGQTRRLVNARAEMRAGQTT